MIDRRTLLAAAPFVLAARPALAQTPEAVMKSLESQTSGKIGVYALNTVTGAALGWRADQRFVMCSTFKASLAACVLSRIDRGQERLDRVIPYGPADLQSYAPVAKEALPKGGLSVAEMCKGAVELSDNTCANKLLEAVGGPTTLTAFWRATGDTVSRLDHNEPLLNRSPPGDPHDTTTPRAMAQTLRRLVLGEALSPASRGRLTDWLLGCQTGANRLRAGLPASWKIGDKTGNNGSDAAGDIAVAWAKPNAPVVMAVYTQGGSPIPAALDEAFKRIGALVGERLG
jgi:beta-lactamase class A